VRSIAHEFGKALGCGAVLSSLRRTRIGHLSLDNAVGLSELIEAAGIDQIVSRIIPIDLMLSHIPSVLLSNREALLIRQGRKISLKRIFDCMERQMPGYKDMRSRYLRIMTQGRYGHARLVCVAQWPETNGNPKEELNILRVWNPDGAEEDLSGIKKKTRRKKLWH